MRRVDKFQLDWQIVRLRAKKQKNVIQKIDLVLDFMIANPSFENGVRVLNWLTMTDIGYKRRHKYLFEDATRAVSSIVVTQADQTNDFSKYSEEELEELLKDLNGRKYDYQYSGAPKTHIAFVQELINYLQGE